MQELSDRLGSYDKKTLELLISRMERQAPPPHLADLSVVQLSETHGRERRHRFFTLEGYSNLVAREGLEQPSTRYTVEDLARAGYFMLERKMDFYETQDDLRAFYGRWGAGRINRPRIPASEAREIPQSGTTTQSVAAASRTSLKEQASTRADGARKRGRPPKEPRGSEKRPQKRAKIGLGENFPSKSNDRGTSFQFVAPDHGGGSEVPNQRHEPENTGSDVVG